MFKPLKVLALGAALAAASMAASAAVTTIGNVTGTYTINSFGEATANVEAFLGLTAGALEAAAQNANITCEFPPCVETGSAIMDSVTVAAGDTLSFNWSWFSDESNQGSEFTNDFAFVTINLGDATIIADTFTLDGTEDIFTFVATAAGTLQFGIGVMNVGFHEVDSILTVSQLAVTSPNNNNVPEPGSLALVGLALGALGLRRRKG